MHLIPPKENVIGRFQETLVSGILGRANSWFYQFPDPLHKLSGTYHGADFSFPASMLITGGMSASDHLSAPVLLAWKWIHGWDLFIIPTSRFL